MEDAQTPSQGKKPEDAAASTAANSPSKSAAKRPPAAKPRAAKPAIPKSTETKRAAPKSGATTPAGAKSAAASSAGAKPAATKPAAAKRTAAATKTVSPKTSTSKPRATAPAAKAPDSTKSLDAPATAAPDAPAAKAPGPQATSTSPSTATLPPENSATPASEPEAVTPPAAESVPLAKSDAVVAGLARLRALAAQFAAPASVTRAATAPVTQAPVATATPAPTPTSAAPVSTPETAAEPDTAPSRQTPAASGTQSGEATELELDSESTPDAESALVHKIVAASSDTVLEVRGLSKRFGDTAAVTDINLNVPAGVFYGIVGPNGAGKTTTLSMITGLLRPDSGTASVNGVSVWDSPEVAKRSIGVLPDRLRIFDRLSGSQLLYYSGVLRGLDAAEVRKRSADLATAFGLDDVLGRLVSDYSSGMLKKVALAAAMIHSPRLLVLDEPFESVDPVSATTVTRILRQYVDAGGTVLLSSHRMELVQRVCSHVAVIVEGSLLADGTIDEVRAGMSLEQRFVQLTGNNSGGGGLEWLSSFSD